MMVNRAIRNGVFSLLTLFSIAALTPVSPSWASSQVNENNPAGTVHEKYEDLKDQVEVLTESVDNLEDTWSKSLNVSGYMDAEYIIDDREGKPDGFRIHHFSLFLEKKLFQDWSVFSELEFEDAPYIQASSSDQISSAQGKILLEQVYSDYHLSSNFSLRAGRFLTPAGIWNINHYPPFVTTQSRPLHIRNIFPQYLDGFQAHGDVYLLEYLASYTAYAANGEGNAGSGDNNESKAFGGRLELTAPFTTEVKVGFSALTDKLKSDTSKYSLGCDAQFRFSWLKIQAEYAQATYKPSSGDSYNSTGYYVQGQSDMGKWTLFVRHDFFNHSDLTPDNELIVNTAGVNYHWTPTIVSKVEGNFYDYKSKSTGEDYASWILSLAVFF